MTAALPAAERLPDGSVRLTREISGNPMREVLRLSAEDAAVVARVHFGLDRKAEGAGAVESNSV